MAVHIWLIIGKEKDLLYIPHTERKGTKHMKTWMKAAIGITGIIAIFTLWSFLYSKINREIDGIVLKNLDSE